MFFLLLVFLYIHMRNLIINCKLHQLYILMGPF